MSLPTTHVVLPLALVSALAIGNCSDRTLSAPEDRKPATPPAPQFAISDAAHGGNVHFFWLPPTVGHPGSFNGPFDGSQSPEVHICDLSSCGTMHVATFTTTSGSGSEVVRVVLEDEHYVVNWHTDEFALSSAATYRISVLVSGTELGFLDVQLGSNGSAAKNLTTNEVIGLVDGRTLPIKFRIEEGAVFVVPTDQDVTVQALGGAVTLDIPAGALTQETGITVQPLPPPPEIQTLVDLGPDGTTFTMPVPVTIGFNPVTLPPGVNPGDLVFVYSNAADPRHRAYPGSVNGYPATNTVTADLLGFSTGGAGTATLAIFCPGDSDPSTYDDLAAALADVIEGGTIEVCAGTHTVQAFVFDKAVTIEGAAGTRPTLTTAGDRLGFLTDFTAGTLTIRNLQLDLDYPGPFSAFAIILTFPYGDVVVDDVDFDLNSPDRDRAILVGETSVAGARLTVQNSTITGGFIGLIAVEGARVDVLNSSFLGQNWRPIQYRDGSGGLIQGNTISPCGQRVCIEVDGPSLPTYPQVEPVHVNGNTITPTAPNQSLFGIFVNPGDQTYEIRNNQLNGVLLGGGDRNDAATYSILQQGIRVQDPQASGDVSGNTVQGARDGIMVVAGTVKPTGSDNKVCGVKTAIITQVGGQLAITDSDITDYVEPIGTAVPFGAGDLTNNWWGSAAGPIGVDPSIPAGVYSPWASSPVANTSTTGC